MGRLGRPSRWFWKTVNVAIRPLAGRAPWWLLVETIGRRTGTPRRTPLAGGPVRGRTVSVLAVHGEAADFVKNIRAEPGVRVRRRGRWLSGRAEVVDPTPQAVAELGRYARWVLVRLASSPKVVRVTVG